MGRADDGWTLFFRFYDLRSGELPPAPEGTPVSLPPRSPSSADAESGVTSSTAALQTPPVETDARRTAGRTESAAAPAPPVDVAPGGQPREFGPATYVHPNATFGRRTAAFLLDQAIIWTTALIPAVVSVVLFGGGGGPALIVVASLLVATFVAGPVLARRALAAAALPRRVDADEAGLAEAGEDDRVAVDHPLDADGRLRAFGRDVLVVSAPSQYSCRQGRAERGCAYAAASGRHRSTLGRPAAFGRVCHSAAHEGTWAGDFEP